ncbi:hypothetical protein V5799_008164 [Amblyomma americanum]|uniref:Uncharacterized protein n=1 Tax=Amblyomma americanum TaxID=6943 RepID=A0AAQ4FDW9_AMBAM
MNRRKREDGLDEVPERKLRKQPRPRLPFFIVEPARDHAAVRKSILRRPTHPESSNAYGDSACEHATIIEQIMRSKREKKHISPLIFILRRHLAQNKTANASTTLGANQTEVAAEFKNETAESSRRRRQLAIDVIKKVILNKILAASRVGMGPQPGKDDSSLGVMTAPALLMRKLPLSAESITKDTGPKQPSFELTYEVQAVKYSDSEAGQELYPYGFGFVSDSQLPAEMTVFAMAMIVFPLPIIGLLLVLSRHFKMTSKRRIVKNPLEATLATSGSKTSDARLTICTNTPCPSATQPAGYSVV